MQIKGEYLMGLRPLFTLRDGRKIRKVANQMIKDLDLSLIHIWTGGEEDGRQGERQAGGRRQAACFRAEEGKERGFIARRDQIILNFLHGMQEKRRRM